MRPDRRCPTPGSTLWRPLSCCFPNTTAIPCRCSARRSGSRTRATEHCPTRRPRRPSSAFWPREPPVLPPRSAGSCRRRGGCRCRCSTPSARRRTRLRRRSPPMSRTERPAVPPSVRCPAPPTSGARSSPATRQPRRATPARREPAPARRRRTAPVSRRVSRATVRGPARRRWRRPSPRCSTEAAWVSSRPARAWARASPTSCQQASPAPPPEGASSSAPRPRHSSVNWRPTSCPWSPRRCRQGGGGRSSWDARTTSAVDASTKPCRAPRPRSPTSSAPWPSPTSSDALAGERSTSRPSPSAPSRNFPPSPSCPASCARRGPRASDGTAPRGASVTGGWRAAAPRPHTWSASTTPCC